MASEQLRELRALLYRRERAATKKISRLKVRRGAVVGGTNFDPRKGKKAIDRMNTAQLNAQLAKVEDFISRNNQYVGGVRGTPLPKHQWESYKAIEREYNANAEKLLKPVEGKVLPTGQSIIDRLLLVVPRNKTNSNISFNSIFEPKERKADQFASAKAIKEMEKTYRKRVKDDYFIKEMKKTRKTFEIMAKKSNSEYLIEAVAKLNNYQFYALWQFTPFSNAIGLYYDLYQQSLAGKRGRANNVIMDRSKETADEYAAWAEREFSNVPDMSSKRKRKR